MKIDAGGIGQSRGYSRLNFRDLATVVGIKAASVHYHFPAKADLGVAVARRYREDAAGALEALSAETPDPAECLRQYPRMFRIALENENRMCLGSFMAAEYDDLPDEVKTEVQIFADVHIMWLSERLAATGMESGDAKARAIFAALVCAHLMARSRADVTLYDSLVDSYRAAGLLPTFQPLPAPLQSRHETRTRPQPTSAKGMSHNQIAAPA
ncbi:TetR/AcrR family transcriptional regulator [Sphingobium sp. AN558]|uniref:TetR/AcrR family transcriptional regulator n=1 Tax=Sphingobium sp. AN558 TaxID=3133442 RepID=UPI0030BD8EAC